MNLTIANISSKVSAAQLQSVVAAISRQVAEHFQPEWGTSAELSGKTLSLKGKPSIQGDLDAIIYLGDEAQDPTTGVVGALAYHSDTYDKVPYGFVYLDVCATYGETWSSALSHEVLELLADPEAEMTVVGPAPGGGSGTVNYDLEVCDPTQGDSYEIDSVKVSNFVGRSYFKLAGGSGKTNYLGLELAAFGVRPAGYFQYEDGAGAHQVNGKQVTKQQLAAKKKLSIGRRIERRKQRISDAQSVKPAHTGGASPNQNSGRSFREVLATNSDLRHKMRTAAALAAYDVIKDAGIVVTPADIADAQSELAARAMPLSGAKMDTASDIANVATSIGVIASVTGF